MNTQELSKLITEFMLGPKASRGKLEVWEDGTLFDSDSNWGFDPKELIAYIASKTPVDDLPF